MEPCLSDRQWTELVAWELSGESLRRVGAHIDGCPACADGMRSRLAAAADHELAPPLEFDDFSLRRPLGRGASGRLYLATDRLLGRPVALKFLARASDGRDLLAEARTLARFTHPNLVAVYRVGEVDGRRYVAYEYVPGGSLERLGPLPWPRALRLGLAAARGLAVAHRGGVLHRDIKPGNLMCVADDELKLVDFGLAQLTGDAAPLLRPVIPPPATDPTATLPDETQATVEGMAFAQAGELSGTPLYWPPETWSGAPATPERDVYSLGLVLHELLAGSLPTAGLSVHALWQYAQARDFPPLRTRCPEVPAGLAAQVDRCLARDPSQRPTAAALAANLDALTALIPFTAPTTPAPSSADVDAIDRSMLLLGSPLALVERFYARLFAAHPFLRPLFPLHMEEQQAKLAGVIRLAVANLRAPEALAPTLTDLGRRHVGYGVVPGHYRVVVDTLLASLGDRLGEHLDARTRAAWSRALEFLVAAMQPAAACPVEQVELNH